MNAQYEDEILEYVDEPNSLCDFVDILSGGYYVTEDNENEQE